MERDEAKRIYEEALGNAEAVLVASQDGLVLSKYPNPGAQPERDEAWAALAASVLSVLEEALKNYLKVERGVGMLDIALADNRHLLVARRKDHVVSVLTIPQPNLGLLYLILERKGQS